MVEFTSYGCRQKKKKELQVTPLIDMVFLLLIFFLLTSYYTKPSIPVLLPGAESAQVHKDSRIIIVVQKDGTFILEKEIVTGEELPGLLHSLLESSTDKKVNIQADTSVRFGIIVRLMDIVHIAGAEDIYFVVEKKVKKND